jgi:hypothetical protein
MFDFRLASKIEVEIICLFIESSGYLVEVIQYYNIVKYFLSYDVSDNIKSPNRIRQISNRQIYSILVPNGL